MATDFSGLVGQVFLATQVSVGTVTGDHQGGYLFTEKNLMADQVDISGTYGADATFQITAVGPDGNFTLANLKITSSNFFVGLAGPGAYGTFLANGTSDFILSAGSIPGLGAAFLYFTNTPAQQPGVGNSVTVPDSLTGLVYTPPCFAAGTRIATARGWVAVEDLRPGDRALLHPRGGAAEGGSREIVWIGHRTVDCATHPRPHDVQPVCVRAGAFGPGLPRRDLWLSPDHAVFAGGVLIPVRYLLNGASIAQQNVRGVTYFHVELDRHDVLLAESLPCESYLDTGNRGAFANGGPARQLHPDFARGVWAADACAELALDGAPVARARAALRERAEALGYRIVLDPDVTMLADSRPLPAETIGATRRLRLPPGARAVRLHSRSAIDAQITDGSTDHRRLGVAVSRVTLDGVDLPLESGRFAAGWHRVERDGGGQWRWSDGAGVLDVDGAQVLDIEIAQTGRYWLDGGAAAAAA